MLPPRTFPAACLALGLAVACDRHAKADLDPGTTEATHDSGTDTDTDAHAEPDPTEDCMEPGDEDGDGLADCLDPDCADTCDEDCSNGVDDDHNGLVDCLDPACDCTEDCSNGEDDDIDGLTDCEDPDCVRECGEDCTDGTDNDLDSLTDCEDADCAGIEGCIELCAAGSGDEDADGLLDCADDDCWGTEACDGLSIWIEQGTIDKHVRSWRQSSGYIAPGTSSRWTWRSTQATFSQDAFVTGVVGHARMQGPSGSQSCTFGFDRAHFHRDEDTPDPWPVIPLVERSGFFSSGACDLSSAQLATGVKSVVGGLLAYGSGDLRSGWWYRGHQEVIDRRSGGEEGADWRTQTRTSTWQITLESGQPALLPLP